MSSTRAQFLFPMLIAGALLGLAACGPSGTSAVTPTPDAASDVRAAMEQYNQCLSLMNADCMAAFFAPQGQIFQTGIIQAAGPAAVRNYLKQTFSTARIDSLTATVDSIIINGDVAVALGTYDEKATEAAHPSAETNVRYVAEWIRPSAGPWLLNRMSTTPLQ